VSTLSRATVVEAAIALADEEGLDSVSLRKLGERLGVTAMAPYRHVRDKDDLLDAMAEELYGTLALPTDDDGDWWDGLAALARSARAGLLAHPWATPLFARPLAGPNGNALDMAMRDAFLRAGFTPGEARELHDQLSNMLFALIVPELRGKPNRAAFERGLQILHAGLAARLAGRRPAT
jgi:AcrR family transcriptional regulator